MQKRCSAICTWAKHCKAMYHVQLMHAHDPHMHAPQNRTIIPNSCEEQCQHAVLEGHTRRLLGRRIFGPRPNPWTWTTEFTTIQNMSFHLVLVSSYHGSATWSFNGHATHFKCYKSSSPPGSCGGLSGEAGESVDMSTEPSRDICGINKKEYLEYAFNPLVLACPNPHPDLLQRHHGIAHYSIISVDQFIHFYVSHFYSIKIWK